MSSFLSFRPLNRLSTCDGSKDEKGTNELYFLPLAEHLSLNRLEGEEEGRTEGGSASSREHPFTARTSTTKEKNFLSSCGQRTGEIAFD